MFASGSVNIDAQAWTHLNCLKEGGFPALLWDTLKDFGCTMYPEYSASELMTTGQLLRWEVNVKIPVCPTHPTWEEWEVKAQGWKLAGTVQKAALEALTTFCEKHADLIASATAKVIPVTEPPKIIPYYRLSRSTWPLSNNKELLSRFRRVKPGKSHSTGSLICAKPTRRRDQSTILHYIKRFTSLTLLQTRFFIHKVNMVQSLNSGK
jgi:hypothetical protein